MIGFKMVSAGLIAAAMLATPAMAREYRHVVRGADFSAPRGAYAGAYAYEGRGCVRAPDVGAYATAPYTVPPCEPGSFY